MSDSVTPSTTARQDPLSAGFSWREYWSRLPCPPPGHLPDPRIEPASPGLFQLDCSSNVTFSERLSEIVLTKRVHFSPFTYPTLFLFINLIAIWHCFIYLLHFCLLLYSLTILNKHSCHTFITSIAKWLSSNSGRTVVPWW